MQPDDAQEMITEGMSPADLAAVDQLHAQSRAWLGDHGNMAVALLRRGMIPARVAAEVGHHATMCTRLVDTDDQGIVDALDAVARISAALGAAVTYLATASILEAKAQQGIPPDVACPFCGGYVRGHQWIGARSCSVNHIEWDSEK